MFTLRRWWRLSGWRLVSCYAVLSLAMFRLLRGEAQDGVVSYASH